MNLQQIAAKNIRALREKAGLSQEDLGDRAGGLNKETVNRVELGANATLDTFRKIAEGLRVEFQRIFDADISDLLRPSPEGVQEVTIDRGDIRTGYEDDAIPVIAEGEATPIGMQWTNTVTRHVVIEYIARPHDLEDREAYGLLVIGDSMSPTFKKGHRLIASPNTPIEDGDEAYVQLSDGGRLIKTVFRTESGWRLESINPKYGPRNVPFDQVEVIHPIVWAKRKLPGRRTISEETKKRIDR